MKNKDLDIRFFRDEHEYSAMIGMGASFNVSEAAIVKDEQCVSKFIENVEKSYFLLHVKKPNFWDRLRCFFKGHEWGRWFTSYHAQYEMCEPWVTRYCRCCGKMETEDK